MKSRIQGLSVFPDRCCALLERGVERGGGDMDGHPRRSSQEESSGPDIRGAGLAGRGEPSRRAALGLASTPCLDDGVLLA